MLYLCKKHRKEKRMLYEFGDVVFIDNLPIDDTIVSSSKGTVVEVYDDAIGIILNGDKNNIIHYLTLSMERRNCTLRRVA
jgi:regulatory protein YycH of two-component signal transduction system YycFG